MTAPLPHGYPDFGRYQAGADKLLARLNVDPIGAGTTYGPYFVGDVTHVRVYFAPLVGNFNGIVRFYDDAALTNLLAEEGFSAWSNDVFHQSFPALAAYMVLRVSPVGAGQSFSATISTAHANWRPVGINYNSPILFSQADINHAVGTTNLDAVNVYPGPASFHGQAAVAGCQMSLQALDAGGTVYHLARIHNVDGIATRLLYLPPMHIRLVILNTTAAVQLFSYAVTVKSGDLG